MSRYRIRVIHQGRRVEADAAAEERWQRRVDDLVNDLFCLGHVESIPPSVHVGWMEPGQLAGGFTYCLDCAPIQPTPGHVPVYDSSYFATRPCLVCGRRLDQSPV